MSSLTKAIDQLHQHRDDIRAQHAQRFFKTGPGEYGQGDVFIGVKVPLIRQVAQTYQNLSFEDIKVLFYSRIHEERHLGLFILLKKFRRRKNPLKKEVFNFYCKHIDQVNNWDLVDVSAPTILGEGSHLYDNPDTLLSKLAASDYLWHRRIAMIATLYKIREGDYALAIKIATMLRKDPEDLIQKAVGWMIREIGKKDISTARQFLNKHAAHLPRTTLRYAIERFHPTEKAYYMRF